MNTFKIYVGDALERLKQLPDESVDCCVTSPPYYGLRDYGTGTWVGGDPNCPHYRISKSSENTSTGHKKMMEEGNPVGDAIYKSVCPLCGAVRVDKQIGIEDQPEDYVNSLTLIFDEVKRVLKSTGTLWLNIGDTYNVSSYKKDEKSSGHGKQGTNVGSYQNVVVRNSAKTSKPKDLMGIPWMVAFALRNSGWYLRQDIIWEKPNPMPEPVMDRFTKSHEYIFLMSKNSKYYFDHDAVQEDAVSKVKPIKSNSRRVNLWDATDTVDTKPLNDGIKFGGSKYGENGDTKYDYYSGNAYSYNGKRNMRDVWNIPVATNKIAHFATFPIKLAETCILAGCPENGTVLDPFNGSGTSGIVAINNNRNYIGIELKKDYVDITKQRIEAECINDYKFEEVKE